MRIGIYDEEIKMGILAVRKAIVPLKMQEKVSLHLWQPRLNGGIQELQNHGKRIFATQK